MPKDQNKKINKQIERLAKRKAELLRDKFKTDDLELRRIWDADIKKIDIEMLKLQSKLK